MPIMISLHIKTYILSSYIVRWVVQVCQFVIGVGCIILHNVLAVVRQHFCHSKIWNCCRDSDSIKRWRTSIVVEELKLMLEAVLFLMLCLNPKLCLSSASDFLVLPLIYGSLWLLKPFYRLVTLDDTYHEIWSAFVLCIFIYLRRHWRNSWVKWWVSFPLFFELN